uniref:Uncharacterized protein n=1 Tax=viral metagenome TaxID=1070528 RepID=A0A6C0E879_9ZZZZ
MFQNFSKIFSKDIKKSTKNNIEDKDIVKDISQDKVKISKDIFNLDAMKNQHTRVIKVSYAHKSITTHCLRALASGSGVIMVIDPGYQSSWGDKKSVRRCISRINIKWSKDDTFNIVIKDVNNSQGSIYYFCHNENKLAMMTYTGDAGNSNKKVNKSDDVYQVKYIYKGCSKGVNEPEQIINGFEFEITDDFHMFESFSTVIPV